jgi:hypothetical protein
MNYQLSDDEIKKLDYLRNIHKSMEIGSGNMKKTSEEGIFIIKIKSDPQPLMRVKIIPEIHQNNWKRNLGLITIKNFQEFCLFKTIFNFEQIYKVIPASQAIQKKLLNSDLNELVSELEGLSYRKYNNSINIAINPTQNKKKIKRYDLYIKNLEEFTEYKIIFNNKKLELLIRLIDFLNYSLTNEIVLNSKMNSAYINQIFKNFSLIDNKD